MVSTIAEKRAAKKWNKNHSKKHAEIQRNYYKTDKGKEYRKKCQAKRKQKYNWILMFPNPFDDSVSIEYHHITDAYVVAIPKDLHKLYGGKYHRENTMEIVKQVYLGD